MNKFNASLLSIVDQAGDLLVGLVAITWVVIGVMLIYPSEKSKQSAKDSIPFVIIGTAIVIGARAIAEWLTNSL